MAVSSYATDLTDIYIDTDNFVAVGGGRVTDALPCTLTGIAEPSTQEESR